MSYGLVRTVWLGTFSDMPAGHLAMWAPYEVARRPYHFLRYPIVGNYNGRTIPSGEFCVMDNMMDVWHVGTEAECREALEKVEMRLAQACMVRGTKAEGL